jgi:RNA polymerase sigma-70 factor (ECF subfamily)
MDARALLGRFMQLYPDIRERLRRRLGSADLADEALNEVYVKLRGSEKSYSVKDSAAYLFRLTLNAAFELRRSANRSTLADRIEEALDVPDPAPGAGRIAEGRQELELLEQAIAALPERRRFILIAARLHERSCRDIAGEVGLSTRMVEIELRRALDHCGDYLAKGRNNDFAKTKHQTSYH